MRLFVSAAALIALAAAACSPPKAAEATASTPSASSSGACDAAASQTWTPTGSPAGGAAYTIEARASGPTCANAVALLVVRGADGTPLSSWAGQTRHIFGLADAQDAAAMTTALAEWADPAASSQLATTAALPEWKPGAAAPEAGEFPFLPESWLDQPGYEALRAGGHPLFCHVQGMESLACHKLEDGQLEPVGVQTFPG